MSTAQSTFQAMWATRPPRIPPKSHDEGSLFGVCQGIAARYQVNVYLIRALFLGLCFAGSAGVSLYILCIFLMPKMGRVSAPVDAIRKPKGPLTPEQKSDRTTGGDHVGRPGELCFSCRCWTWRRRHTGIICGSIHFPRRLVDSAPALPRTAARPAHTSYRDSVRDGSAVPGNARRLQPTQRVRHARPLPNCSAAAGARSARDGSSRLHSEDWAFISAAVCLTYRLHRSGKFLPWPRAQHVRDYRGEETERFHMALHQDCDYVERGRFRWRDNSDRVPDRELTGLNRISAVYSHSMVAGGLDVISRTTRLTSSTSLVMRVEIVSSTS